MNHYEFRLNISPEAYLDYYRGAVRFVIARCSTGQTVQFPAALLTRYVSTDGVRGQFVLVCDANNKCIELRRTGPTGRTA